MRVTAHEGGLLMRRHAAPGEEKGRHVGEELVGVHLFSAEAVDRAPFSDMHFADDVRAEEWAPSYAATSSRMDFIIERESLVVEVKMTRRGSVRGRRSRNSPRTRSAIGATWAGGLWSPSCSVQASASPIPTPSRRMGLRNSRVDE